jgi:preprotein translocase subunit SecA
MYQKLSHDGYAKTEESEFMSIYDLESWSFDQTSRCAAATRRGDLPDEKGKFDAIVEGIKHIQPRAAGVAALSASRPEY